MIWRLVCNVNYKICNRNNINLVRRDVLRHFIHKNASESVRSVSTKNIEPLSDKSDSKKTEEDDEFITIYSQPSVKYLALFNKAIYYPTVVLVSTLPISTVLWAFGFITDERYYSTAFLAVWLLSVMHIFAVNVWRRVGFLYVNKDMNKVKIGYVSYWGNRKDIILAADEIMAFSDMPRSPVDLFYRKVKIFNSKMLDLNSYKLDFRGADIVRPDIFNKIFGSPD